MVARALDPAGAADALFLERIAAKTFLASILLVAEPGELLRFCVVSLLVIACRGLSFLSLRSSLATHEAYKKQERAGPRGRRRESNVLQEGHSERFRR